MILCLAATACLLAPAPPSAGASRPPISLVALPAHVVLTGGRRQTIRVQNSGTQRVVVDVTRAGFALDLRGRPRVFSARGARPAFSWLALRPRWLVIPPGQSRPLLVAARLPPKAVAGDHEALVLLTSRPKRRGAVFVRMRLGVVVVVRVPGKVVHRLAPLRLHVRRAGRSRLFELLLANRGNVTETVSRPCLALSLRRGGRVLARLTPVPRRLLPRSRGIVEARYRGRARGWVTARIDSRADIQCRRIPARTFRVRL